MDNSRSIYEQDASQPHEACPFPVPHEIFTNSLAELAEAEKFDVVSQTLRTRGVDITLEEYDNWDGGIWTWLIRVPLLPRDWAKFSGKKERTAVENKLAELADAIVVSEAHRFIVKLAAIASSSITGVTNQGRAHSANLAAIEHEGLLFRSDPEVLLFIALRNTGLPVMPLPVVISNGKQFKRIEPDFVVIKQGMTFVIELDGDFWHKESPSSAHNRLLHLESEGVRVIRISAKNCNSADSANNAVKQILSLMEQMLKSR